MSTEENLELTAAEYARLHGLSADHLAEPLPMSHIEALRMNVPQTLTDDTGLPCIEFPLYVDTNEHLTVDKGAAELLQAANNGLTTSKEVETIAFSMLDGRLTRKLRVETPLLKTDHMSDFKDFAKWEQSHRRDGSLPMEPLDEEMDVGLEWPQRLLTMPGELMKEVEGGKIEILKETLVYLQAAIKDNWTEGDEREVWEGASSYIRVCFVA